MTSDHALHAHLIGRQGGRLSLNTPVLTLDLDALDRNIARMAATARARGVALRPHAKTHKSADIARRQIAAGAMGQCCAKLGEAEALAAEGIGGLLITSPIVPPPAVERLAALHAGGVDVRVVADHPDNVAALARAIAASGAERPLLVLVDVDPGLHRTGVPSPEAAVALARRIVDAPALTYAGVQFYCGAQQHLADYAARRAKVETLTAYLQTVLDALAGAGLPAALVTGGGTGTHAIDLELGVLTELQVGSYVFMDREYADCDPPDGGWFETALFIESRVVSANTPGLATVDAGLKSMATEAGAPRLVEGAGEGARFIFMGDEHGAVVGGELRLGNRVVLQVPHCDPTVNLYDSYHVVQGDALRDIWPVTARGRSR